MADNQQISKLNIKGTVFDIVDEYARSKIYEAPTYTSKSSGLYKITIDGGGHVSAAAAVTASDLPSHTHDHSHTQYLTAHQSLAHSHTQYATTGHSHSDYITTAGTGLSKSGQTLGLKTASDTEIGGIKVSFTTNSNIANPTTVTGSGVEYGISIDKNNLAYITLPDFSLSGHSHSQYLTSLSHSHSQYLTAHQNLAHSHTQYATTGHSHSQYLTAHQSLAHSHSQYAFGTGTLANLTGATSSTDNTGKLWGSYTLVQWMSDIIGADLSAISSTSAEIEKILEDNDVSTGLLKRISSLESGKADKSATVSTITYDTTNKKITKTINGTTTDVITAATIVTDGGGIKSLSHSHSDYLTSIKEADTNAYGGIKLYSTKTGGDITTNAATTTSGRYYQVQLDHNGHAFVNIPWTDTDTKVTSVGNHYASAAGAKASGLYKITTDAAGHITAATAVAKADITGLGIPGQDTQYTASTGLTLSGTQFSLKTATEAILGGVKVSYHYTSALDNIQDVHAETAGSEMLDSHYQYHFGLQSDSTGKAFVNIPQISYIGNKLESVNYSTGKLTTTTDKNGSSVTEVVSAAQIVTDGGGIKSLAHSHTQYATTSHSHSNYLTSLAHSHTQYLTAHQSLSHSHSEYVRLDNVWYNSTTKTLNIGVAPA